MKNKMLHKILIIMLAILTLCIILIGCNQNVSEVVDQQKSEQNTDVKESLFTNINEEYIDANNIMSIIQELASEKYLGRLPGTEGNKLASEYIIDYFKEIGLVSPNELDNCEQYYKEKIIFTSRAPILEVNNYQQYYKQKVLFNNGAPILELVDKSGEVIRKYNYITQFSPGIGGINVIKGEVTAPAFLLDDVKKYKKGNEELSGKILIMPQYIMNKLNYEIKKTQDYTDFNWIMSEESGVKGIVCEFDLRKPDLKQNYFLVSTGNRFIDRSDKTKGLIQMACNTPQFNEIKKETENGALLHINVDYSVEEVEVPNIIGVIQGTDEELKDQFIIISAHFDHVGDNKDGTYNPGALDNASGTATMMEIARVMMENEVRPRKSVVFIAFNGEEEDLDGSKYYVNNPIFPLENSIVINMDMVGANSEPLFVMDNTLEKNNLKDEMYEYVKLFDIDNYYATTIRADHKCFCDMGVEAITLIQPDEKHGYHSPMDTIENVNKSKIEKITKVILYYLDKNAY